jgi:hypothetical protein
MNKENPFTLTTDDPNFKFQGFYRGWVIDDEDPRDIGRIKVRVPGVYREEVNDEDIPWALPATGLYRGGGNNAKPEMATDLDQDGMRTGYNVTGTGGMFTVPSRGNHVWIFFDMGNHMNPHYFAMAPGEDDWLTQKQTVKDKIEKKIKQIKKTKDKFTPDSGPKGYDGVDWADGVHQNSRQDITSGGEITPYEKGKKTTTKNFDLGGTEIDGGKYKERALNTTNADEQGKGSDNMGGPSDAKYQREFGTFIGMDVKPLFDKEEQKINRSPKPEDNSPHGYDKKWKYDDAEENGRNVNRYITSFLTEGGTTIVVDNREGQENFYLIHKNYMENIDQEGSRKVYIGRNDPNDKEVRHGTDDERNRGVEGDIRSNDELLVDGDKKIHVLGNFVTYVKGNALYQVDKNMQIDVNDTCGFRIKRGDFDIVLNGNEDASRNEDSDREDAKTKQYGDLNIDVQDGHMEVHVKKNVNMHVEGQVNLRVDGDMRTHVLQSYHLHVEGDYDEFIEGNKYTTVQKNVEERYNFGGGSHRKTYIQGSEYKDVLGSKHLKVTGTKFTNIGGTENTTSAYLKVGNAADFTGIVRAPNFHTPVHGHNEHIHPQNSGNHYGGGTVTSPGIQGAQSPGGPSSPSSGQNSGGGTSPDSNPSPVHVTTGVPSNTSSTNKTIKAKRRHDKRKHK